MPAINKSIRDMTIGEMYTLLKQSRNRRIHMYLGEGMSEEEYDAERDAAILRALSDSDLRKELERRTGVPARMSIAMAEARRRNTERVRRKFFWRWN